ncbi:MAG: DUF1801 domain-containing protein [Anaerolineaceae bacterium]
MLPTSIILSHFRFLEPEKLDLIIELRNIIASVAPDATEDIQHRGLSYYDATRGGHVSAGICQINIQEDHIRLAFIHGAFLPDPNGLLMREGERKAKRFIRLDRYDSIPWEQLKELIKASASFNPYSLIGS